VDAGAGSAGPGESITTGGDHAMTEEIRTYPTELPLVPLREMVVFPKIVQPLGVGREKSVAAINAAMNEEKAAGKSST